jgi:hypothetical protein
MIMQTENSLALGEPSSFQQGACPGRIKYLFLNHIFTPSNQWGQQDFPVGSG